VAISATTIPAGAAKADGRTRRRRLAGQDGGVTDTGDVRGVPAWGPTVAKWVPRLVLLAALWCVVAIVLTPFAGSAVRFGSRVFGLFNIPVAGNVFTAALLFVLGSALAVRKRAALWFVIVGFQIGWLVVAAFVTVLKAWDIRPLPDVTMENRVEDVLFILDVATAFVLIAILWWIRPLFPARLAPGSWKRAAVALGIGLAVSACVGIVLTELFPNTLHGQRRRSLWPIRTALGLEPEPDSRYFRGAGYSWVAGIIGALSTIALLWAFAVLLRSVRAGRNLEADDELALRRLLRDHGDGDSLGYFATRRDKMAVFSPDGRAAVTYRVEAGTSLASADPIGDQRSWPAAIQAWMAEAVEYGWALAVLGASERGATAYRRAGLRVIALGDEAVIDVNEFRLNGVDMAPVRQAVSRVRRAGYHFVVRRHGEIPGEEMATLAELAERWRGDEPERGFSMTLGRLGDPADGRCVMATALDASGEVRALLSFVPWGRRGLSLDLMRRDPTADNGVVEFMIAGMVGAARGFGVRRLSLNFAVLRSVFSGREQIGAGPVLRLTAAALTFASRWWQIETLYRSNVKYRPRWDPRFMCFQATFGLNRGAIAAAIAEGFLPGPPPGPHRQRSTEQFAAAVRAIDAAPPTWTAVTRTPRGQLLLRSRKLEVLAAHGVAAYPVDVPRTTTLDAVRKHHARLGPDAQTGELVSVVGRIVRLRDHGGLRFAVLLEDGVELQIMLARDALGAEALDLWSATVDRGDQVSVTGEVVTTRSGELSVMASAWAMAAKCLRPVPADRPGATDALASDRNLELTLDPRAHHALHARAVALATVRRELVGRGFLEVETPMLQAVHGGANARPFVTHINAYDLDLYLRIAPELFLKRLVVSGIGQVFELNRSFRNEGADGSHNPEFTSLEVYEAHGDYTTMRRLARDLVLAAASAVHGRPLARRPDGWETPLDVEWPVVTVHDAVSAAVGEPIGPSTPVEQLRAVCAANAVVAPFEASAGVLVQRLYDALVEPATTTPTFFTDFPVEVSPLARVHRHDPRLAERWDLVAYGMELGTAYSELTDPIAQRARLTMQSMEAAAGDPEAMEVDEDFLAALELGLVPTGGLGLGIDRLLMLVTGTTIRGTLAFPFVKPARPPGPSWLA
jgi:lysyl-tRNA synthetase, class II